VTASISHIRFLVYRPTGEEVGTLEMPVRHVVTTFTARLMVEHKIASRVGERAEFPRALLIFHERTRGELTPAPIGVSSEKHAAWIVSAVPRPLFPVVEATLKTSREELVHKNYALHDVVAPVVQKALAEAHGKGAIDAPPGPYVYDVEVTGEGILRQIASEGSFELPLGEDAGPALAFEPIDEGPRRGAQAAKVAFTVRGSHGAGLTRLDRGAWQSLSCLLPMPLDKETGGYLVGDVALGAGGDIVVTVRHAVEATNAAGNAHTFLMSPESGAAISTRIDREWPGLELVGWYHTHVFSADNEQLPGLSSVDEGTHDVHFSRSWQLAGLVNVWRVEDTVHRRLRIYRRTAAGKLIDAAYDVVEEAGS
jgi:hypothetical protein